MRILLDECLPKDLAGELVGHHVKTVPQAGWASISNGKLLRLIASSGKFDVFLTMDKRLPQQNKIRDLPFAIVVLRAKIQPLGTHFPICPVSASPAGRLQTRQRLRIDPAGMMVAPRIVDPIIAVINTGTHVWGKFPGVCI